jgi:phosphoribosylanthranilate isomerase
MHVKICGITNLDDALCAADAGADMLGFIFFPASPRSIDASRAREIAQVLHARAVRPRLVGVFVDEDAALMQRVLDEARLDLAQLSGNEPAHVLAAISNHAYKVVRRAEHAELFASLMPADAAPQLLLEADHPTLYGGTGQRADDALAAQLARRYRILLAGGLTPENVGQAVRAAQPWGVDVASGVEASKGRKDHAKVRAFIDAAKAAGSA